MSDRNVFAKESEILRHCKEVGEKKDLNADELRAEYDEICRHYEDLLIQGKLITKVSDRLQNKLNNANEALGQKNVELQNTIDELTKTRIGKKATTIVLGIAIILFLVSEALNPLIEAYTDENLVLGLASKGLIAVLLKPVESFVETYMIRKAKKKREAELKTQQILSGAIYK